MLQTLFSDAVVAVETRQEQLDDSLLWPEEAAALGEVVPGRRWDWVMGRRCAREAMASLGIEPAPVLAGEKRQPLWPSGVVGAITHTHGYAAAAVASDRRVDSIGVDAEPDEALPAGVLRRIAFDVDHHWLDTDVGAGVAHPPRLLFSIKEAVYKAWYPLTGTWLGFEDARVRVEPATTSFEAEIRIDGPVTSMGGRYTSHDGVVIAAIELSATNRYQRAR